jgi:hypothetical protein
MKQRSFKTVKNELKKVHSIFIRLRDSDENGYGKCISCGKPIQVWFIEDGERKFNHNAHAGHYYSRGASKSLYFDDCNVNLQCVRCNAFKGGANQDYAVGLVNKYGPDILQKLWLRAKNESYLDKYAMDILIADYKRKIADLRDGK